MINMCKQRAEIAAISVTAVDPRQSLKNSFCLKYNKSIYKSTNTIMILWTWAISGSFMAKSSSPSYIKTFLFLYPKLRSIEVLRELQVRPYVDSQS